MIPLNVIYHGSDTAAPDLIELCAGLLSASFDPESGAVRGIRLGESEILRGVYVAVRDRNWCTVVPTIHDLQIESRDDSFRVTFEARCLRNEIDFIWIGAIRGESDGTVRFSMTGTARSTFLRNRIGLCVLYPSSCAGQPCTVETSDGLLEYGAFPDLISPHQPFKQIRALVHEPSPGIEAEVRFEGDVFEMEDERNWTDASFKVYGTPIELPFPVEISAGASVAQSIALRVNGLAKKAAEKAGVGLWLPVTISLEPSGKPAPLPRIGFGCASHNEPLSPQEIDRLKALAPAHLRVDLLLAGKDWKAKLAQSVAQARAIGTFLEVAVFVSDSAPTEFADLTGEVEKLQAPLLSWLMFCQNRQSIPENLVQLARTHLKAQTPEVKIGAGTNANFAELNRHRPLTQLLDLICYSINPQVHAFDDASVMETLSAQADTVRSARTLAGGVPVAVTPVTLRPRFNAVATGPEAAKTPGEIPWPVDVRQTSLFAAAWTLGSLKRLSEAGAQTVTYYETTGWRGLMETRRGSPAPEKFRSVAGGVFPMYHVFADVAEFAEGRLASFVSSDPGRVDGLTLGRDGRMRILCANLTAAKQSANMTMSGHRYRLRMLDETNVVAAMQSPEVYRATGEWMTVSCGFVKVELRPYAVACIDVEA